MLRASLPAIGALLVVLLLPAVGHAAEVGVVVTETPCSFSGCGSPLRSGAIVFRAAPGEANRVGYAFEPGRVVFTESGGAPLTAGTGCQELQAGTVACGLGGAPSITVETGDGADRVEPHSGGAQTGLSLHGGPGDDVLVGGSSRDTVQGGGGRDALRGGGGDDDLDDEDGPRGDADTLDGGPGADEISYAEHTDDLEVDLDRAAGPDGDVLAELESVTGGSGDDRLTASNRPTSKLEDSPRILDGGKGRDTVRGRARDEYLFGGEGRDVVVGGKGWDRMSAGPGRDRVSGGPGSDEIETADGAGDVVRCGPGRDLVRGSEDNGFGESDEVGPDAQDRLAPDCETAGDRTLRAYPLRISRAGLRLRNTCRPCSRATVTIRVGKRVAARGRMAGRRTALLAWRRQPRPGRSVNARVVWDFQDDFAFDYAFTIRLRIP